MGVTELHQHLQELARNEGEPISYTQAAHFVDLTMNNAAHRMKIGQILDDIYELELAQGHPMLSALVVQEDNRIPGHGFFKMAKRLGRLKGNRSTDEIFFYAEELKRVYEYWKAK